MKKPFHLLLHLIYALAWLVASAFAQGDYSRIATLNYPPVPVLLTEHYYAPTSFAAVMQMQAFLRTGEDTPLSAQYLMTLAGPRYEDYSSTAFHGFGAFVGMELSRTFGSCPAAMCQPGTLRLTDAMHAAATPYRTGYDFLTLTDLPDYPVAVQWLAANHGAAVVLTTGSYRSYAILGANDGLGLWFDPAATVNRVRSLSEADGVAQWESMIYGQSYGPENYVVGLMAR